MPSSSHDDDFGDSVYDSTTPSGLSTIRDSRLYAHENGNDGDFLPEEEVVEGEDIVRSVTPRALEANVDIGNRPNPPVRAQSDPTSSRSTSNFSPFNLYEISDDVDSPLEVSTPQLPVSTPSSAA